MHIPLWYIVIKQINISGRIFYEFNYDLGIGIVGIGKRGEELIEKLTNEVDNYSLEEIKTELGHALVEQMSAEEDVTEESSPEANFSLNINIADNNLGNTAWDLVKRHKQGK